MSSMADSEFGKEVGLVHKVIITGRKVGADRSFWTTLADDEEKFRKVVEVVMTRLSYEVTVNRDITRTETIKAGKYDWVNSNITVKSFPEEGKEKQTVNVVLFHFSQTISFEEAISEMEKEDFRPADIDELLAFGAVQPELQRVFPIVALGSVWQNPIGRRYVAYLCWSGVGRGLELYWLGVGGWPGSYRFAGVCR